MQPIVAAHRQVSEAPILPRARPRKRLVRMMQIVHHGHAEAGSLQFPMDRARAHPRRIPRRHANPRDLRRQATIAIAPAIPTTAALTSRHNRRNIMRRPTTTATAAIRRSRHTRRRELIPHRAAAIQLRLAPTPHPAAVTAAAVVAPVAVEAEAGARMAVVVAVQATGAAAVVAHTAVEVPARTAGTKSFLLTQRPIRT